jgi:DNA mismatch endonuclease (patch repair protein)
MADIVTPEVRSRMMAGIRAKNTQPELLIRRALFALGFRFRIHDRRLPGKPDIVLPKYRAVILIHGCFWHGHRCHLFKWPSTRPEFWRAKIEQNSTADSRNRQALRRDGWRILTIWECALKGRAKLPENEILAQAGKWVLSIVPARDIRGAEVVANRGFTKSRSIARTTDGRNAGVGCTSAVRKTARTER